MQANYKPTSMSTTATSLPLRQVRKLIRSERGAIARIAETVGVHRNSVHDVLAGRMTSEKISKALQARALELLAQE